MDKFESQFEDLDVQTSYMENSMGQTTAISTPQDQIDELIMQVTQIINILFEVADENGLEMSMNLPGMQTEGVEKNDKESDELTARLAKLRNP